MASLLSFAPLSISFLSSSSYSLIITIFLAVSQASYTPLLPPNSLPPPDPNEPLVALIRINDQLNIEITRNDLIAQTRSLTLPGSLPLPEYGVDVAAAAAAEEEEQEEYEYGEATDNNDSENNINDTRPADELPGIDITSAEVINVGVNYSWFGYFFWSSSEEYFVSPAVKLSQPFRPADSTSSSSLSSSSPLTDTVPPSSPGPPGPPGPPALPNRPPPNTLIPYPATPPFPSAERISFYRFIGDEVIVFIEVMPKPTIDDNINTLQSPSSPFSSSSSSSSTSSSPPPRPRTRQRQRQRQKLIPEIRTALLTIPLRISFRRSFGPGGIAGSGFARVPLPSYARDIRRIVIVDGPTGGCRCRVDGGNVAVTTAAEAPRARGRRIGRDGGGERVVEFEGPNGDGRVRGRRAYRERREGRERGARMGAGGDDGDGNDNGNGFGSEAEAKRHYLQGPIYGATGLTCYGLLPDDF